ncbi:MAG: tRNA (guanosine(46)-N7)-methyltransferase TrmB [Gammaproteobacteria bacterium]|nr:tRNA (guanosine(46)-N7)-methyltransferase TrmB [Gammaproteobacteria bacterium]MBT8133021.1 tRNA (guanosine(46)-N7)-methyltransferase TrmB [Gammaproteobacteria bacterium]NNJ49998.1 tRNA (guanosine(46)-N7)-methyltransferase TrmB [Gammaproteobacteria bacterium]
MSTENSQNRHREIKSFVLRQGRLTAAQQSALQNHWQDYGIDYCEQLLDFKTLFDNDNEVILEIGFGNGESLLQQAITQPQYNFIGIEVHAPGVGHLIHEAQTRDVHNIRVIRHDAVEVLQQQIADASITQLQLFFPDPWHKKRHHKRRIMKPAFIELVNQKLKTGGFFHMATDWQHYAEQMLEEMDNSDRFRNISGQGNYSKTRGARCETKFERRGIRLGHGVWDLIYEKL